MMASRSTLLSFRLTKPDALLAALLLFGVSVFSGGCGEKNAQAGRPTALDVEVAPVKQKDVQIYVEHIGTLDGLVDADVRAQVTGYLLKQTYVEGSFVRKGQLLFQIDPRPFQATLDQAKAQLAAAQAQLANAEANQQQAQLNVDKYTPLAKEQAASQQDLDNAVQTNLAAKATVLNSQHGIQAAQAAVDSAQINLDFTRLVAPIDGIAGQAQLQVGALVSTNTSSPITSVSTVNPIKAFITVSEAEYLEWRQRYPTETSTQEAAKALHLQLILADGSTYSHEGSFDFTDLKIDQGTGAIRICTLFPNPYAILRPGGYARVRAVIRTEHNALVVPQRAVSELQGSYQVAVVDAKNQVSIQPVKVGDTSGSEWVIAEGLKPGERVVAEGVQKVRPGMTVNPKPFGAETKGE